MVYYQDKPWDGPEKLSDMMDIPDKWKSLFEDYRMVLVKVVEGKSLPFKNMTNTQFFELVQDSCKLDKTTLIKKYVEKETIAKEALLAAGAVTGTKQFVHLAVETKGDIVMCENMEKIFKAEKDEGKREGHLEYVRKLMKNTGNSFDEVCKLLDIVGDEKEELRKLL